MAKLDLLFKDVPTETTSWHDLNIIGSVPSFLRGKLFRVGPGKFKTKLFNISHWFDGFGHIVAIDISSQKIRYKNKFIRSICYKHHSFLGGLQTVWGMACRPSLLNPIQLISFAVTSILYAFFPPFFYHLNDIYNANPNVSIFRKGETDKNKNEILTVTTDSNSVIDINENLEEIGGCYRRGTLWSGGQLHSAHPEYDKLRKVYYNLTTSITIFSSIKLVMVNPVTNAIKVLKRFFTLFPSYQHGLGQTENYIIYISHPYKMLCTILLALPFVRILNITCWIPFIKNSIFIFDKRTSKIVHQFKTDPFFFFHTTNGYEDKNGDLVLELISYDKAPVGLFYIKNLLTIPWKSSMLGHYVRFRFNLADKTVKKESLFSETHSELQVINPSYKNCKHQFVYAVYFTKDEPFSKIIKMNTINETSITFADKDLRFGEPIFIGKPKTKSEDDGVLLSLASNLKLKCSTLVGLDSKSMTELFRVNLPVHITMGFHGTFLRK